LVPGYPAASIPGLGVPGLRIEGPALGPGFGIQRDHLVLRRAKVEEVADLDRRVLVLVRSGGRRAGAIGPRDLQLIHVGRVDLVEWGIACAVSLAPVVLPAILRIAGIRDDRRRIG